MDLFQYDSNPWGQEILVRISWDLLWASLIFAVLFMVGHLVMRKIWFPAHGATAEKAAARTAPEAVAVPDKVEKHSMGSRLFHWVMAAAMFALLITAFFPVLGIQFPWLTIHWVSGFVLIGAVLFHIVHSIVFKDMKAVSIGLEDLRNSWRRFSRSLGRPGPDPGLPGKYPLENKLYHHAVSIAGLGVIVTGVLMMYRVDTPLFTRDPYMFSEQTWGWVYVIHGLSSVALVALVMAHVYFAVLPEKRWMTWSMINGRISREKYLEHHDPERWPVGE